MKLLQKLDMKVVVIKTWGQTKFDLKFRILALNAAPRNTLDRIHWSKLVLLAHQGLLICKMGVLGGMLWDMKHLTFDTGILTVFDAVAYLE